jgi:acyl-CoA synthetase (AMP-forming)/AMP-acid ligase II
VISKTDLDVRSFPEISAWHQKRRAILAKTTTSRSPVQTNCNQPGHDFARIALRHAEINPHGIAFRFIHFSDSGDELVTYESLISNFAGVSEVIAGEVPVGARAVLIYEHGAAFIYALLACFWARIIAVPVPPPRNGFRDEYLERLRRVLVDSGAKIVLTTAVIAMGLQRKSNRLDPHPVSPWQAPHRQ